MKNSEIMARALADASGVSLGDIQQLVSAASATLPPGHRLDDEVPEAEAARMLESFRRNQQGIRLWLLNGYVQAVASAPPRAPTMDNAR